MFSIRAPKAPRCAVAVRANRSRRQTLGAVLGLSVLSAGSAKALIPDDDDEEMVQKAKSNRQARLKEDKEAAAKFIDSEGMRNRSAETSIMPIQTAVFKLAKAGEALEKDDAKGAAGTLQEPWVGDFVTAGGEFAKTPDTKTKLNNISSAIQGAADAAGAGNVAAAKVAYVGAVEAVEDWVQTTGIAGSLKGL